MTPIELKKLRSTKIEAVVTLQYAKRNIGDKGKIAVAEIMSACRFPDGALDEYERAFAENARLRAALTDMRLAEEGGVNERSNL